MSGNKNKGSTKTSTTSAPATNGGLTFVKLGKDFQLPTIQKKSGWEETLLRMQKEAKGEVVMVYSIDYDKARKAYNKNKALRKQAAAMGIKDFNSSVRKQMGEKGEPLACIFAGIGVGEEAEE